MVQKIIFAKISFLHCLIFILRFQIKLLMKQFKYFIACCALLMPMCAFAQQADGLALNVVEQMPEFPGGQKALYKYLSDNIRYPVVARENGIEGTVYIGFVVNTDGQLSNIVVKRGVAGGCTEESVRVISSMPKWIPGKHNGEFVRVNFTMPIKFKLDDPEPIYTTLDTMPTYPEGEKTMFKYLAKNIIYPAYARENGFAGTVRITFVVNSDGSLSNFVFQERVGGGCDEEALRVIKAMPKWIPGVKNGQKVSAYCTLPIKFALDKTPTKLRRDR
jgi:TonB family protein